MSSDQPNFLQTELRPLWAALRSPFYWISLAVVLVILLSAYQFPFYKSFDLSKPGDQAYLVDYYAREENKEGLVYRWTQPSSNVKLAGVGQPPIVRVRLELSPRPGESQPNVEMRINNELFRTIGIEPNVRKIYELEYYPTKREPFSFSQGELDFWMRMEPLLVRGDPRPLGIVVSKIEINGSGLWQTGRLTIPAWETILLLLITLAILGLAIKRLGWNHWAMAIAMLGTGLLLASGLAMDRPMIGLGASLLPITIIVAYIFMVSGLWFVDWWLKGAKLTFTVEQGRWLGVIFLVVFLVRAIGINHPSFQTLDHGFRIHETYALLNEPSLIFSRYYNMNTYQSIGSTAGEVRSVALGQWELAVAIPYSPLFYVSNLPIAALFRNDEKSFLFWTNIFALWWETSSLFLLYIISRQSLGRYGNVSGLVASFLSGFFPLTFLLPSDGGYPSMQANWLTLLFLVILSKMFLEAKFEPLKRNWRSLLIGGIALTLAMLAHTSTLLLLSSFLVLLTIFLSLWGKRYTYLAGRVFLISLLGWAGSFAMYYGFYVIPLLTTTLPALASKVGQGQSVGDRDQTLKTFGEQITAHFHLFPFVITLGILGYLWYAHWNIPKQLTRASSEKFNFVLAVEIGKPALLMLMAWFGTFVLFSVAAIRINLLHKHMLFAVPLFGLGCGLLVAFGFERHQKRLTQIALVGLVLYFLITGSVIWFQRVINYILPAGTG